MLFFNRTVDGIVSSISSLVADLDEVMRNNEMKIERYNDRILTLETKATAASHESNRAARIKSKLGALIE